MALTPKQEAFAQAVASGKSQADAYRAAYSASKMKPETVQRNACKMLKDNKVSTRVAELRKPVVQAAQITLASHLTRLQELSQAAEKDGQFGAAISAEVARGKASGLYVDKTELTGPNGGPLDAKLIIEYVRPNSAS